ncbi:MAG: penicillin-binding protein 1A [Xanthobacteraceae bacterium]
MNTILVKIFATALAFSQVTTRPDTIKTQFDPVRDQAEVTQLLRDGCAQMRKAFDVEDINLDDLISTAMDDTKPAAGEIKSEIKALRGLNLNDLVTAYREFCKNETIANSPVAINEVIAFYNRAAVDLPDHTTLKGLKLPGVSVMLDRKGERFTEVFEPDHRRTWVPLSEIPESVQQAFVAAEDKRFFEHHGIDERGLIRAFVGNLTQAGRPQGGSTITQQVTKNLLVGDDVTYERKIREMIVASRIEHTLSKGEILELYLNSIYLGRSSWGIEMAARSYFGKSAKNLTLGEGALLAGLTKGPSYFSPDRNAERAQERRAYVLSRMQENGVISAEQTKQALSAAPRLVAFERPRHDSGLYFVDQLGREAKAMASIDSLTATSYTVRSTIDQALQRATEAALQEGLARYEMNNGRVNFQGPEANLADTVRRLEADPKALPTGLPIWQLALQSTRLPLYDVHWAPAMVMDPTSGKAPVAAGPGGKNVGVGGKGGAISRGGDGLQVGLMDGRVLPLTTSGSATRRNLKPYDVIYVMVQDGKGKTAARAELRVRPTVQGAVVILENKTGRVLAMTGGFSYPTSQLNRVTQAQRQPGSAIKPLTYLAALQSGLQPDTLVQDSSITLPPINGTAHAREQDYWSPKNYSGGGGGITTLRRGLENSKNLVTAHLLDGGIDEDPAASLDRVCELAVEARIYPECERYYPFVLGAQPVRPIDLAAFYATVANEGARPTPYLLESVEQDGHAVYQHRPQPLVSLASADRVSFYQLKTMLQGVVERGTARAMHQLSPYVAGKTGTSEDENDTWFVGFTNDITVAVWVGYDNADGKRHTLGAGSTGSSVAAPIFESIIQSAWAAGIPKVALNPPSAEARQGLAFVPIDVHSGERVPPGSPRAFIESFRLDSTGAIAETRYTMVSRGSGVTEGDDSQMAGGFGDQWAQQPQQWSFGQPFRGFFDPWWQNDRRPQQRRVDPDYLRRDGW